ncbi:MAG: phosphotransferase [Chloroflexota bacterium]
MLTPDFTLGARATASSHLFTMLTETYNIGTLTTTHDLGGTYNLNVALHTLTGQYVARVYRPWVTKDRLQAVHRLKNELITHNIPVVLPYPTHTGTTYTTFEDRLVEVEPLLRIDQMNESLPSYLQAATMLGQLHNVLLQAGDDTTIPDPCIANYASPEQIKDWILHVDEQLQYTTHSRLSEARTICSNALTLLEEVCRWWDRYRAILPRQLIHGDYGLGNIAFREGNIIGLLDFDFVARRERVFELAYTTFWMIYRLQLERSVHTMWDHVEQFVTHYEQTSSVPLTDEEWMSLPVEMVRVPLYWLAEVAFLSNPADEEVVRYARHIALAQQICNEQDVWLRRSRVT